MILLDTHVVIWLALQPERLSPMAADALRKQPVGRAAMSSLSVYEIGQAVRRKRIEVEEDADTFLRSFILPNYHVIPVTAEIAAVAAQFAPPYPRDPMDRIIGATTLVEGMDLITADVAIRSAGMVPVIW